MDIGVHPTFLPIELQYKRPVGQQRDDRSYGVLGMTFSHDLYLARGHKEATKWCLDGRKQNNTCTAVPVRKGTIRQR